MHALQKDPLVRLVKWRDLLRLSPAETMREILLPAPWLTGSIAAFEFGQILLGAFASFFFFLTALRVAHGAQHYSLGIDKRWQDALMLVLGVPMIASLHALQATHMLHHRRCLSDEDVESSTAKRSWLHALLHGPWFIVRMHAAGYRLASAAKRRWILAEFALAASWLAGIAWLGSDGLRWFAAAATIGECLTGFFAVWTVHHDCDATLEIARTQRGRWKNWISHSMFFHVEHHLFPSIPTARLPELAARLDEVSDRVTRKQVF